MGSDWGQVVQGRPVAINVTRLARCQVSTSNEVSLTIIRNPKKARRVGMPAPLKASRCLQAASMIRQVKVQSLFSSISDKYACSENPSSSREQAEKCNGLREDVGSPREPLLKNGTIWLGLATLGSSLPTGGMVKEHVIQFLKCLRHNPVVMSATIAWLCAQLLKVFTAYSADRRLKWKMLIASGGMPSSHSALCIALTTAVALMQGIQGPLFPVCLGFSLIVMYDATGVRYHAGMQAEVLNVLVEEFYRNHPRPMSKRKLKELLGHTPMQVGAGALLGALVTIAYFKSPFILYPS